MHNKYIVKLRAEHGKFLLMSCQEVLQNEVQDDQGAMMSWDMTAQPFLCHEIQFKHN